jgi:hypothetical protein
MTNQAKPTILILSILDRIRCTGIPLNKSGSVSDLVFSANRHLEGRKSRGDTRGVGVAFYRIISMIDTAAKSKRHPK